MKPTTEGCIIKDTYDLHGAALRPLTAESLESMLGLVATLGNAIEARLAELREVVVPLR